MENSHQIKFRAWDKEYKKMFIVRDIYFSQEYISYEDDTELVNGNYFSRLELMQWTGLKDNNGVEIYEGDIVKHSVHNVSNPIIKEIMFWEGSFIAKPIYDGKQSYMSLINFAPCKTMEVIGNIYENNELLT